ncbi:hypothetical protein [Rhizobium leguminosarum]
MDGWLKGLIAVTCVVVMGGIGYFVVTDSAARKANQARNARAEKAQVCEDRAVSILEGKLSADDLLVLTDCMNNRLMSEDRLNRSLEAVGRSLKK